MASGSVDQIENGAFGDSNAGRQEMTLNLLDVVILQRDLPERGLAAGDLGTIVELYGDTAAEVEFVRASGRNPTEPGAAEYRSRAVHHHHRADAAAVQHRNRHTRTTSPRTA